MFCTLLRKRPEWAPAIPKFLASQTPRWSERTLNTHDVAIPLPQRDDQGSQVRMLLLSALDFRTSMDGWARIERLYHLSGGHQVAIVFLLAEGDATRDGIIAYMELQAKLLMSSLEMPILPISSIDSLQKTLFAYQRQVLQPRIMPALVNAATMILPYCTERPPLAEHTKNVLSDIFPNFRGLATAATTREGQEGIRKWLSGPTRGQAEGVISFWLQEYVAD